MSFPEIIRSGADFSPCRTYRYVLWRRWETGKEAAMFIGLNPSTADEKQDDPTIRRCMRFAHEWGYGAIWMLNLFAYRATKPSVMKAADDPVGPENNSILIDAAENAGIVVGAWGAHGMYRGRALWVEEHIPNLYCLDITKCGNPKHPLYLRADIKPVPFPPTLKR